MKKVRILFLVSLVSLLICLGIFVARDSIIAESESEGLTMVEKNQGATSELVTDSAEEIVDSTEDKELIVCIDAGHQQHANMEKEPIGPGASETKPKVAGGTMGVNTGLTEYQLNLDIALKLQEELEGRGYTVVMIRTTNDVDISNSERAEIANSTGADVFVKIHADGSEYPSVSGATSICQTPDNPYNGQLYDMSRLLAECVLDGVVESAGCERRQVFETDDMSGINWSQVPTTIIEVGYLSNREEEEKLNTDSYQSLIASGIADGIDAYFNNL